VQFNLNAVQEDLRKVGIALMLAGLANLFFSNDSYIYSQYIVLSGMLFWFLGVVKKGV
jgi:hypothetical protein